jgi:hypothetical protein
MRTFLDQHLPDEGVVGGRVTGHQEVSKRNDAAEFRDGRGRPWVHVGQRVECLTDDLELALDGRSQQRMPLGRGYEQIIDAGCAVLMMAVVRVDR